MKNVHTNTPSTSPNTARIQLIAWAGSGLVALLALLAWWQDYGDNIGNLSTYQIFPLLGLVAFSLMWAHYAAGTVRQLAGVAKPALQRYYTTTSMVVLVAILLHPTLLIWQLWRDGLGLPPTSYLENYIAPNLAWAALLGMLSLIAFLLYDLTRRFQHKSWWKYVNLSSDAAMIAVWVHGLNLGTQLQAGWYKFVWMAYGLSLLGFLIYKWPLTRRLFTEETSSAKPAS